jgi:predicted RNase H-like HicB family nuclease
VNKFIIIIEKTETGFSAYSPDIPGCVSTGASRREVEVNMKEAVEFHLDGLREEGYPLPEPSSESVYLEVAS